MFLKRFRLFLRYSLLVGTIATLPFGFSRAQSVEGYLSSETVCSLQCERIRVNKIMRENVDDDQQEIASSEFGNLIQDQAKLADVQRKFRRVNSRFIQYKRDQNIAITILKGNNVIVRSVANLVPVLGEVAGWGLDEIEKMAKEGRDKTGRIILRRALEDLKTSGELEAFDRIPSAEQKAELLLGPDSPFGPLDDPDVLNEVQSFLIKELAKDVDALMSGVLMNAGEIAEAREGLHGISKQLADVKATREAGKEHSVPTVGADVTEAAAKGSNPTGKRVRADRELLRQVDQFARRARLASQQSAELAKLFDRIGSPDLAKGANFVAGATNLAAGVAASYANPAMILPTLNAGFDFIDGLGLSGKPRPDPVLESLKQIIAMLDQIYEQMEKNHQEILARFDRIERNQMVSLAFIRETLAANVDVCRNVLVGKLDDKNRLLPSASIEFDNYAELLSFYNKHHTDIPQCIDGLNVVFKSGSDLSDAMIITPAEIESLDAIAGGDVFLEAYRSKIDNYFALGEIGFWKMVDSILQDKSLLTLGQPSSTVEELNAKIENFDPDDDFSPDTLPAFQQESTRFVLSNRKNLVSPLKAQIYAGSLVGVHSFYELTKEDAKKILTLDEIFDLDGSKTAGLDRLNRALDVLDTAILQQVLVSGDILLPALYAIETQQWELLRSLPVVHQNVDRVDFSDPETQAALRDMAGNVLAKNSLLAQNFALYSLYRDVSATGKDPLIFYPLLAQTNPALLEEVTSHGWDFEYSVNEDLATGIFKGWRIVHRGMNIPLPNAASLARGQLLLSEPVVDLLHLRERVLAEIAGYHLAINEGRDANKRREFREVLAMGLIPK